MTAIKVENLHKTFFLPHSQRTTLKESFLHPLKRTTYERFEALKDVSFEVKKGEWVGVIGRNGSGKSTLLKILAGIYVPDGGKVEINGKVIPLLELGVGFNSELSGRENIFLNGTMLGMRKKEIQEKFDAIVDFAEIRKFLDLPLKNYSSGMQVRLAFAIASQIDADIYLLDEVLAVGDLGFQEKCNDIFKQFRRNGKTVLLVSHSMENIETFCDAAILLDSGIILTTGEVKRTLYEYNKMIKIQEKTTEIKIEENRKWSYRIGNRKAEIVKAEILNKNEFESGEKMEILIEYKINEQVEDLILGLAIYPENSSQNFFSFEENLNKSKEKTKVIFENLNLLPGKYFISLGLTNKNMQWIEPFDLYEKKYLFSIKDDANKRKYGIVNLSYKIQQDNQNLIYANKR